MDYERQKSLEDEYTICEPSKASKKEIYSFACQAAEYIHEKFENLKKQKSIYNIIELFGGTIHTITRYNNTDIAGSIYIHNKGNFDVLIPEYTSPLRDNFTLAHELGHYLLHTMGGKINKKFAHRQGKGRLEWEANWFAAGFLIPEHRLKELKKKIGNLHENAGMIGNIFGVSEKTAIYRIETFNNDSI